QLLLEAAFAEVSEHGYFETTVDDIARRAGVAKGTLYLYFRDKPDIYIGLVGWLLERALAGLRATAARPVPARQKLVEVFETWSHTVLSRPAVSSLLSVDSLEATSLMKERVLGDVVPRVRKMVDEVAAIIEQGIRDGEFRRVDARLAALTYLSGFRSTMFVVAHGWPVKNPARKAQELFFDGILARRGPKRPAGSRK
ncbi:TetR/AcrR family transcriptional regulator, partial [candidate division WOR-3 bacterium]|nr:TetR/AcrR family transcriptional regulator [candidate division WOR-3 bacterium]